MLAGPSSTLTKTTATSDLRRAEAQKKRTGMAPTRAITTADLEKESVKAGSKRGRENEAPLADKENGPVRRRSVRLIGLVRG